MENTYQCDPQNAKRQAEYWNKFLIKGIQENTLRIVDLDEVAFNDFKAFINGYLPRLQVGETGALYYHKHDPIPPSRDMPFSAKLFGNLFGKLSILLNEQKKTPDGLAPFTQQREVDRFERNCQVLYSKSHSNGTSHECGVAQILIELDALLKRRIPFILTTKTQKHLELLIMIGTFQDTLQKMMEKLHFEQAPI